MADPNTNLNLAFPSRVAGDAVIDSATNDTWVYDGVEWINRGTTVGERYDDAKAFLPYNEQISFGFTVFIRIELFDLPDRLELPLVEGSGIAVSSLQLENVTPEQDANKPVVYIGAEYVIFTALVDVPLVRNYNLQVEQVRFGGLVKILSTISILIGLARDKTVDGVYVNNPKFPYIVEAREYEQLDDRGALDLVWPANTKAGDTMVITVLENHAKYPSSQDPVLVTTGVTQLDYNIKFPFEDVPIVSPNPESLGWRMVETRTIREGLSGQTVTNTLYPGRYNTRQLTTYVYKAPTNNPPDKRMRGSTEVFVTSKGYSGEESNMTDGVKEATNSSFSNNNQYSNEIGNFILCRSEDGAQSPVLVVSPYVRGFQALMYNDSTSAALNSPPYGRDNSGPPMDAFTRLPENGFISYIIGVGVTSTGGNEFTFPTSFPDFNNKNVTLTGVYDQENFVGGTTGAGVQSPNLLPNPVLLQDRAITEVVVNVPASQVRARLANNTLYTANIHWLSVTASVSGGGGPSTRQGIGISYCKVQWPLLVSDKLWERHVKTWVVRNGDNTGIGYDYFHTPFNTTSYLNPIANGFTYETESSWRVYSNNVPFTQIPEANALVLMAYGVAGGSNRVALGDITSNQNLIGAQSSFSEPDDDEFATYASGVQMKTAQATTTLENETVVFDMPNAAEIRPLGTTILIFAETLYNPLIVPYINAVEAAEGTLENEVKSALSSWVTGLQTDGYYGESEIFDILGCTVLLVGPSTLTGVSRNLNGADGFNTTFNNFIPGDYSRAVGLAGNKVRNTYIENTGPTAGGNGSFLRGWEVGQEVGSTTVDQEPKADIFFRVATLPTDVGSVAECSILDGLCDEYLIAGPYQNNGDFTKTFYSVGYDTADQILFRSGSADIIDLTGAGTMVKDKTHVMHVKSCILSAPDCDPLYGGDSSEGITTTSLWHNVNVKYQRVAGSCQSKTAPWSDDLVNAGYSFKAMGSEQGRSTNLTCQLFSCYTSKKISCSSESGAEYLRGKFDSLVDSVIAAIP